MEHKKSPPPDGAIWRIVLAWRERRKQRQDRRQLLAMSERELRDLGIGRSEIRAVQGKAGVQTRF